MESDETGSPDGATADFRSAVEDAVLAAFARGVDVDEPWYIESPVADAPSWLVEVTKLNTQKENGYDPTLIEE